MEAIRPGLLKALRGRTVLLNESVRLVGTIEHFRDVLRVVVLRLLQKFTPSVGSKDLVEVRQRLINLDDDATGRLSRKIGKHIPMITDAFKLTVGLW